jgi:glycosyltransferase involved in cell wall biosynthesis
MTVRVWFDATRLLARGGFQTPTGIDRVDLAYARAFADARDVDLRMLAFDRIGPRLLDASSAERLIAEVSRRWDSPEDLPWSEEFTRLRRFLESPAGTERPAPISQPLAEGKASRLRTNRLLGALRLRRLLAETQGTSQVYVNVSHGHLFRAAGARWLARTRIPGVFFVHDLIPLEYPEFCRPEEPARHAARLDTIANHARLVLVNSRTTRDSLLRHFESLKAPVPATVVLPLGVEQRFAEGRRAQAIQASVPYFVCIGTIEPRKNHLLLLQLWRRLIELEGDFAPRLVVVGRRGWENQAVFSVLDRSPTLARHVIECSGLGDLDLAELLGGARALLSPSFVEGYGLPVAEALTLGTPVVASAIPAHKEVGGACAEYLDPLDGPAWLQAVRDYAAEPSIRRSTQLQRLLSYRAPDWNSHLVEVLERVRGAAAP